MKNFYFTLAVLCGFLLPQSLHCAGPAAEDGALVHEEPLEYPAYIINHSGSQPECVAVSFNMSEGSDHPPFDLVMYLFRSSIEPLLDENPDFQNLIQPAGEAQEFDERLERRFFDSIIELHGNKPVDQVVKRINTYTESGIIFSVWEPGAGQQIKSISVCSDPDVPLDMTFRTLINNIIPIYREVRDALPNLFHDHRAFVELSVQSAALAMSDRNMFRIQAEVMSKVFPESFENLPEEQHEEKSLELHSRSRILFYYNPERQRQYQQLLIDVISQRFMKQIRIEGTPIFVRYMDRDEIARMQADYAAHT